MATPGRQKGGYTITGETLSYGAGLRDVWLMKTDSNGNKEIIPTSFLSRGFDNECLSDHFQLGAIHSGR